MRVMRFDMRVYGLKAAARARGLERGRAGTGEV